MVYVVAIQRQGTSYKVTLPKAWVNENLEPSARIMYLVTKDIGVIEVHSERSWYAKYFSKNINGPNKGTPGNDAGPDRSGLPGGVSGVDEDQGTPSTDNITERA